MCARACVAYGCLFSDLHYICNTFTQVTHTEMLLTLRKQIYYVFLFSLQSYSHSRTTSRPTARRVARRRLRTMASPSVRAGTSLRSRPSFRIPDRLQAINKRGRINSLYSPFTYSARKIFRRYVPVKTIRVLLAKPAVRCRSFLPTCSPERQTYRPLRPCCRPLRGCS